MQPLREAFQCAVTIRNVISNSARPRPGNVSVPSNVATTFTTGNRRRQQIEAAEDARQDRLNGLTGDEPEQRLTALRLASPIGPIQEAVRHECARENFSLQRREPAS